MLHYKYCPAASFGASRGPLTLGITFDTAPGITAAPGGLRTCLRAAPPPHSTPLP